MLTEDERAVVIGIASQRNQWTEIELEAAYLQGGYDSVRKAGILWQKVALAYTNVTNCDKKSMVAKKHSIILTYLQIIKGKNL